MISKCDSLNTPSHGLLAQRPFFSIRSGTVAGQAVGFFNTATMKRLDVTGNKYWRLSVISYSHTDEQRVSHWNCICECGNKTTASLANLNRGNTKSCGCLQHEFISKQNTIHGLSKMPEYHVWKQMRQRCNNPNNKNFFRYGGRGIKVCDRWSVFDNFIADMKRRPSSFYSIDRFPDNDGNYEPSNCRWATAIQQANNRKAKGKENK